MYKSRSKIISKFVEKLLKYRILFKDILACLALNYRDVYNIVHCFPRNQYLKNQINRIILLHKICLKNQHV